MINEIKVKYFSNLEVSLLPPLIQKLKTIFLIWGMCGPREWTNFGTWTIFFAMFFILLFYFLCFLNHFFYVVGTLDWWNLTNNIMKHLEYFKDLNINKCNLEEDKVIFWKISQFSFSFSLDKWSNFWWDLAKKKKKLKCITHKI